MTKDCVTDDRCDLREILRKEGPAASGMRALLQLASLQVSVSPIGEDVWRGESCESSFALNTVNSGTEFGQRRLLVLERSVSLLTRVSSQDVLHGSSLRRRRHVLHCP